MNKYVTLLTLLIFSFCTFSCKKNSNSESLIQTKRVIEGEFSTNYGYESICKTTDNNIVIVAKKGYPDHLYVAMMNSSLDILWEKSFTSEIDNAGGITASSDGGVVIASDQYVPNGMHDVNYCLNLKKLNSKGDLEWRNEDAYGATTLQVLQDGSFVVLRQNQFARQDYAILYGADANGHKNWEMIYTDQEALNVYNLYPSKESGFVFTQYNFGPMKMIKTDNYGNKLSEKIIGSYGSMGIVLLQNKYCCYCYESNTSTHYLNLVINLVD
jgi:hypothetical protein